MSVYLVNKYLLGMRGALQSAPLGLGIFESGDLLNLRIGAMVDFSSLRSAFAGFQARAAFQPPSVALRVVAHGFAEEEEGFTTHHFYLAAIGCQSEYMLEIISQHGQVDPDFRLFQRAFQDAPQTSAEWDTWLQGTNSTPPYIGGMQFTWDSKRATYSRVRGCDENGGPDAVERRDLQEGISANDNDGYELSQTSSMLYGRALDSDNTPEWFLVQMAARVEVDEEDELDIEFDDDLEGDDEDEYVVTERWIEAYVGVTIGSTDFRIC